MPQSVNDLTFNRLKCMVYGDNGTGKTRLIGTAPRPIYILNFDPGPGVKTLRGWGNTIKSGPLKGQDDIQFDSFIPSEPRDFIPLNEAYNRINELQQECPWATVALDSLTYAGKMILRYIADLTGHWHSVLAKSQADIKAVQLQIQDWEAVASEQEKLCTAMLEIDANVIITSHERVSADKDNNGNVREVLYLPGRVGQKFPSECPGLFDEIYRMFVKTSPRAGAANEYKLQMERSEKWVAMSRLKNHGVFQKYEEPDFSALVEKAKKGA